MKKYSKSAVYFTSQEVSPVRVDGELKGYVWERVFGNDVQFSRSDCSAVPAINEDGSMNYSERWFKVEFDLIEMYVMDGLVLSVEEQAVYSEMVELQEIEFQAKQEAKLKWMDENKEAFASIEAKREAKAKLEAEQAAKEAAIAAYKLTPVYLKKVEIEQVNSKAQQLAYKLSKIDRYRYKGYGSWISLEGVSDEQLKNDGVKYEEKAFNDYRDIEIVNEDGSVSIDCEKEPVCLPFIAYKDCLRYVDLFTETDKKVIKIKELRVKIYELVSAYELEFGKPKSAAVPVVDVVEIEAGAVQYLSEINDERFKDGLPYGIVNKKKTDAGGTFFTMSCGVNYIVVCPRKELVNSICKDENLGKYGIEVQGLHSGIDIGEIAEYIARNEGKPLKFAVTWDSFERLCSEIETINIMLKFGGLDSFKVMVDEYQMLLDEVNYRENAISSLFRRLKKSFEGRYTLLSATPTPLKYTYDELKGLPFYQINWANERRIFPVVKETRNLTAELDKIIKEFNKGCLTAIPAKGYLPNASEADKIPVKVEELYIYLNSVKAIVRTIDSDRNDINPKQVRVVCGDKEVNIEMLETVGVKRSNSTDYKAPGVNITFLTSTGFQGCNFFSNNALSIIVSKAHNESTFLSIDTTVPQIMGRLRYNDKFQNVFHNIVWHLLNTKNTDFMREDYKKTITEAEIASNNYVSKWSSYDEEEKTVLLPRALSLFCTYDKATDVLSFSNMKKMARQQQYDIAYEVYKNGTTVADNYKEKGYETGFDSKEANKTKKGKGVNLVSFSFKERIKKYYDIMDEIKKYEASVAVDTPFGAAEVDKVAAEVYEKNKETIKLLETAEGMYQYVNTLKFIYESGMTMYEVKKLNYKKEVIVKQINKNNPATLSRILREIIEAYNAHKDINGFVSNKVMKVIINDRFRKEGFEGVFPVEELKKFEDIEVIRTTKRIGDKRIEGVSIKRVK